MFMAIASREFRNLFISPTAWSILAVVQFIMAYIFLSRIELFFQFQPRLQGLDGAPGVTDIVAAPLFGSSAIILLLIVPMLSMRLLSEERANGTLSLLLASPVSLSQIVIGKFLGLMGFFLLMQLMITLMPLSLLIGGQLDLGQLAAGSLGMLLMTAAFVSIGLFMSSLTAHPTVAGISCFGVLLLLWIIDWSGKSAEDGGSELLGYLSITNHFQSMLKGMVSSADIAYYLLICVTFLVLSIWRLETDRLKK